MKDKLETYNAVVHFVKLAEKQTNCQVKIIQSDGGTKYKTLSQFFLYKGIVYRTTCPCTSEQNGLVERKHRNIVETGLTLLAQASLALKFGLILLV